MKTKITDLSVELKVPYAELMEIAKAKLSEKDYTGAGKRLWLTEAAVEKLKLALAVPPAVPDVIIGQVLSEAPNNRWVYCTLAGKEGKHPVLIPNRLRGKLVGKKIEVHAITDATGTTYRHAALSGYNH
jgi:hypothetical protein